MVKVIKTVEYENGLIQMQNVFYNLAFSVIQERKIVSEKVIPAGSASCEAINLMFQALKSENNLLFFKDTKIQVFTDKNQYLIRPTEWGIQVLFGSIQSKHLKQMNLPVKYESLSMQDFISWFP